MPVILIYILMINIIGFIAFGIDKYKARRNRWRISEFTLMLFSLLGGGIGCFVGMRIFHHKTRHALFTVGIPLIILLEIILCIVCTRFFM